MIAYMSPGEERALEVLGRITFSTYDGTGFTVFHRPTLTQQEMKQPQYRNGFRQEPINPGKRIKSPKAKR